MAETTMGSCWTNHHRYPSIIAVTILILLFAHFIPCQVEASTSEYNPVAIEATEYGVLGDYARRRLAPFQLCLLCKCCTTTTSGGAATSICTTMPCCFGIDCQLPNKPFGVCAFVPKTCNCNSCAT
ncbi:hypothetical protein COLO4_20128 [Corchorus olitorius]|uniref:DUF7866 domain-containing protein n=1 Tax=Corchorus olitorius TaxID=93759 RepID=A0A1R3J1M3_9ROSI|nr:hypothetical protein COLO4_20128 [Corchorus olitorius]